MKSEKVLNIIIYILLIILVGGIIYFAYIKYSNNPSPVNPSDGEILEYETYSAIFVKNGADSIEYNKLSCQLIDSKCEITLPEIVRKDGYVLGWSENDSTIATYQVGDVINLSDNMLFYAITYSVNTLNIMDNNIDYVSSNDVSCKVYNDSKSCTVIVPNYNKIGYENRGYSLRSDSLTGVIFPNSKYTLKGDVTLYPIYNTLTRKEVIKVDSTRQKYGITIEIENNCPSSVASEYLNYLDKINNNAKYLLIGSKITFLSGNTFDRLWGNRYMGMNYGPNGLRLFDIKCPNQIDSNYYATMVHELAHTWDFYYSNYFSRSISEENDYINLYSKYERMNQRPFRDYSYTNIREFMADTIRYYYFKYLDPRTGYKELEYPADVKNVLEKYICIANNDYKQTGC